MTENNNYFEALNKYFDQVYVLTLPRAKERQEMIKKTLKGLNWRFFYGVDKNNLDYEKLVAEGVYNDSLHKRVKRTSRSMSMGEIACSLSHVSMYEDMLKNSYRRVLILEDDVLPQPDNLRRFQEVVQQLPEDWQVLMLGYYGHKPSTIKYKVQQRVYKLFHRLKLFNWHKVRESWIEQICMSPYSDLLDGFGKVLGTHAYAITADTAKKFIDYQKPVKVQADRIFNYYQAEYGLKGYATRPTLFTLSELSKESYIQ